MIESLNFTDLISQQLVTKILVTITMKVIQNLKTIEHYSSSSYKLTVMRIKATSGHQSKACTSPCTKFIISCEFIHFPMLSDICISEHSFNGGVFLILSQLASEEEIGAARELPICIIQK